MGGKVSKGKLSFWYHKWSVKRFGKNGFGKIGQCGSLWQKLVLINCKIVELNAWGMDHSYTKKSFKHQSPLKSTLSFNKKPSIIIYWHNPGARLHRVINERQQEEKNLLQKVIGKKGPTTKKRWFKKDLTNIKGDWREIMFNEASFGEVLGGDKEDCWNDWGSYCVDVNVECRWE